MHAADPASDSSNKALAHPHMAVTMSEYMAAGRERAAAVRPHRACLAVDPLAARFAAEPVVRRARGGPERTDLEGHGRGARPEASRGLVALLPRQRRSRGRRPEGGVRARSTARRR